jgi:hypothetical protein
VVERDDRLRNLERERMYTIFAPLDSNEPLPRELLKDARRYRTVGRRELAGALWLPALAALLILSAWSGIHGLPALALIVLLLLAFVGFALSGKPKSP